MFLSKDIVSNANPRLTLEKGMWISNYFLHCSMYENVLTHWGRVTHICVSSLTIIGSGNGLSTDRGRVTHICVSSLTIIGSGNGLSTDRRQAMIWTNAGILIIRTLRIHFSEIFIKIHTFSFKKMHLKMSSVKWRPFCLGLNVLSNSSLLSHQSNQMSTLEYVFLISVLAGVHRFASTVAKRPLKLGDWNCSPDFLFICGLLNELQWNTFTLTGKICSQRNSYPIPLDKST